MALTSGFFNSIDHDRRYDARQFSRIYDGVINDGIFMNIGDCMVVKAAGNHIEIGTGRAWFNGTWSLNDSIYPMELPLSDVVTSRIDMVVLEVDTSDAVRNNSFKIIQGIASHEPVEPELIHTEFVNQYPLCAITRAANTESVIQADIKNLVGSEQTPFVTGILKTVSMGQLLGQWESELDEWKKAQEIGFGQWSAAQKDEFEAWMNGQKDEFGDWADDRKQEYDDLLDENQQQYLEWNAGLEELFDTWFGQLQTNLSGDVAGNLQVQINSDEIQRILTSGFVDGVKTIAEDGSNITTVASDGRILTKTFTPDFLTLTTVLKAKEGATIATQIKTFDTTGRVISTSVTYNLMRRR